jgi:hypothetical protein
MKLPKKLTTSIAVVAMLTLLYSQETVWARWGINSLRPLAIAEKNNRTDIINDNPALLDEAQTSIYRAEFLEKARARFKESRSPRAWTWEQITKMPDAISAVAKYCVEHNIDYRDVLRSRTIAANEDPAINNIISSALGKPGSTGNSLCQRLIRLGIDWDDLLMAAGLIAEEIRKKPLDWTVDQDEKIVDAIKAVAKYCDEHGIDQRDILSAGAMWGNKNPAINAIISDALGRPGTTGRMLCSHVSALNLDWYEQLNAAKLDVVNIRKGPFIWTKDQDEKIVDAIKAVAKYCDEHSIDQGDVLSARAMRVNQDPAITGVISDALGRLGTTGAMLYSRIADLRIGWYEQLKEAGLDHEGIRKPAGTFGNRSWWENRYYPSMLARDTAIILAVTGIIPESDIRRGKNWEKPFYKTDTSQPSYVDFYSNNGHGPLIFEPHGKRAGETLEEYRARRLQEYQGTWAAEVPQDNVFVFDNTRTLIRKILPRIGIEVTSVQLAQIDQLIAKSEEDTRQYLAEARKRKTSVAVAGARLDVLKPEPVLALQAI